MIISGKISYIILIIKRRPGGLFFAMLGVCQIKDYVLCIITMNVCDIEVIMPVHLHA